MKEYTHLHCHTAIGSLADSMVSVDQLFKRAKELGQKAIALTEHGTLASLFDGFKASQKYGIKYIPGCEFYFVDNAKEDKQKRKHLVLLAKNEVGYRNLLKLNYEGYANAKYLAVLNKVFPQIDLEIIKKYHEGLICLTACGSGPLATELFKVDENNIWNHDLCHVNAFNLAAKFQEIFGEDLYLEVQAHDLKKYKTNKKTGEIERDANGEGIVAVDQTFINRALLGLSQDLGIKLVATCDVHYLEKEDAKVHDMLMAINEKKPLSDKNRHRYEIEEFYMKSGQEVHDFFSKIFNKEIADSVCSNTLEIANKCGESSYIEPKEVRFPKFNVKAEKDYEAFSKWANEKAIGVPEDQAYLRFLCINEFNKRFSHFEPSKREEYKKRMIEEIKVFEIQNFSSYMLVVMDFIRYARENNIPIGCGRGSCGGSLVGNLLKIHEADPIQYGLVFERFLNKEKKSFPDIDTDISPTGREQIKQYLVDKYGQANVAYVSNLSRMTPKVTIKDLARSLELGGNKSEAFHIANKITDGISIHSNTFDDALKESKEFADFCAKYPDIEKYGRKLVGLEKTFSTHAGGVIISDIDLSAYIPLRFDKAGDISIQYEKERCEQMKLIKMDLLGLEHLDIINDTIKNVRAMGGSCPEPHELAPHNDAQVWNMISSGNTTCVFQVASHLRPLCKQIRPRNIEDLSLVNALGRPSAAKSRSSYIARRDGREKVTYLHECLKPALEETLGVCVYEEQLMKVAKYVAGWNFNKADGLRKLTKLKEKGKDLAVKLKCDFIEDSIVFNNLSREMALEIWDTIVEPFTGYGFNKSHGIFYSLNGYTTAYYKYHYPAAFMSAALKSEVSKTSSDKDKVKINKKEAERLGLKIITPDINSSGEFFTVSDSKNIRMGLAAVNGVGTKAVQNIIEARSERKFDCFADFLYRTNSRVVRKDVIQSLAKAGCFDSLSISRKSAHDFYGEIRTKANKHAEKKALTGVDSCELLNDFNFVHDTFKEEWTKKDILNAELETLGEYISGSITDVFEGFFTGQGVAFGNLKKMADKTPVRIEAVIESVTESKIQKEGKNKGSVFARCTLIDKNKDIAQMTIWANLWKKIKSKNIEGKPIRALCRINAYKGSNSLVLDNIEKIME
ncbi:MAG: DUF655 domain-containing protein [Patescibacteria group bacterium]